MCVIVLIESFTIEDNNEYEYKILSKYCASQHHFGPKNAIAVVILRLILVARTSYQM